MATFIFNWFNIYCEKNSNEFKWKNFFFQAERKSHFGTILFLNSKGLIKYINVNDCSSFE